MVHIAVFSTVPPARSLHREAEHQGLRPKAGAVCVEDLVAHAVLGVRAFGKPARRYAAHVAVAVHTFSVGAAARAMFRFIINLLAQQSAP